MELELNSKTFGVFKDFFGLLKILDEELTMYVDDTGILVQGMDTSHVAMVVAKLLPGLFDKFEPSEKKITVNLAEFNKFLDRMGGKKERPTIQYNAEQAKLTIQTKNSGYTRRFSLPVLEPLDQELPKPKLSYKCKGRILTQSIDRAIKDSDLVSQHLKFEADKDKMKFEGKGDVGSAINEFEGDGDELLELNVEEDAKATYTLSYLKDIFGALKKLADVVTLEFATDMPLRIEATPAIDPNIEISLFLAPCIGVE